MVAYSTLDIFPSMSFLRNVDNGYSRSELEIQVIYNLIPDTWKAKSRDTNILVPNYGFPRQAAAPHSNHKAGIEPTTATMKRRACY